MNDTDFEKAVNKEKNKINRQLKAAKISAHKMKILEPVIENVSVMKVKLEELREQITQEDFMVEYDNGGGQKGIKENPIYKRYESFFKTYMVGMGRIIDTLPDQNKDESEKVLEEVKPQTALDIIMEKQNKTA